MRVRVDRARAGGLRVEAGFHLALLAVVVALLGPALVGGKVLSPGDVLRSQRAFGGDEFAKYEPANRLLMDPVLQFEPWIELCREAIGEGRLPLWNDRSGLGAPLLANGQSAVFDPFHWIAFFGPMPSALAWMAMAKLMVAGAGMWRLSRTWGLSVRASGFAGLAYPLCGYMAVWLLYPLTSVTAWMPWLFWSVARLNEGRKGVSIARVAAFTALVMVGGHVQTSAHVVMAAGLYVLIKYGFTAGLGRSMAGGLLGVGMSAVAILPLAGYLAQSPAWSDRIEDHKAPWELREVRWKEAACWAVPYVYGSQRAGHPNLAKALGVENLNESAGGFAGLGTLICLAPIGLARGWRRPEVKFLGLMAGLGALASVQVPPVDNLLRMVPVLNVMDHRRLTLWVAFGLVGLGAVGLDRLGAIRRGRFWGPWMACWMAGALFLLAVAIALPRLENRAMSSAQAHYQAKGLSADEAEARAERQVRGVVEFLPRYYAAVGVGVLGLAAVGLLIRGRQMKGGVGATTMGALVLVDLFGFGYGLNPMIGREDHWPESVLVDVLRRDHAPPERVLAIGEELPPNLMMRYGLADVRNYDSVELESTLDWFEPIFEPEPGRPVRSSRLEVTWESVARGNERLREAGVSAVVGAEEPPAGLFDRVRLVEGLWIGEWEAADVRPEGWDVEWRRPGEIRLSRTDSGIQTKSHEGMAVLPIAGARGWRALGDRARLEVGSSGPFLSIKVPGNVQEVFLTYWPREVELGRLISGISVGAWVLLASGISLRKNDSKPLGAVPR